MMVGSGVVSGVSGREWDICHSHCQTDAYIRAGVSLTIGANKCKTGGGTFTLPVALYLKAVSFIFSWFVFI